MKPEVARLSAELNASLQSEIWAECERTGHVFQAGLCLACGYRVGEIPTKHQLNAMMQAKEWPDPNSVTVGPKGYMTPAGGPFTRVTTVCNMVGTGKDALINWSADLERAAVLEAAGQVYAGPDPGGPTEFVDAISGLIGDARSHQRALAKAGDIGTAAHQMVQWKLDAELGKVSQKPTIPDASLWAYMAFEDWYRDSGLKVVRTEQPVWDETLEVAGTIDAIMDDTKGIFGGGLGVLDLKTSKGLYDTHHIQVGGAYLAMGRRWAPLNWAALVRLPKVATDPLTEVKQAGDMRYDYVGKNGRRYKGGHQLTYDQLWTSFKAALTLHRLILEGRDA